MVEYKCDKCGKEFTHKATYIRHTNRKKSCTDTEYICKKCSKKFSSYSTLYKHTKKDICSKIDVPSLIDNSRTLNNKTINNSINNNNNIGVDGDVKVVKFGNENLSHISSDLYKQILGRGLRSVQEFIEHSNFHPDHPENHNIYIANIRDEYLVLFDGFKWSVTDRDELMEDIIYARSDYLLVKFNELSHEMDPRDVLKFENFMKRRDDDDVLNKIKGELTLQFYNNRYLPLRQRKKMELLENQAIRDSVNNTVSIRRQHFDKICEILAQNKNANIEELRQIIDVINKKLEARKPPTKN